MSTEREGPLPETNNGIQIPNYNRQIGQKMGNSLDNLKMSTSYEPPYGTYVSSASLQQSVNIGDIGGSMSDFGNSLDKAVAGFGSGSAFGKKSSSFGKKRSGPKEGEVSGGILKQLLGLIQGAVSLPMRFSEIFQSLTKAGLALGLGAEGLGQSAVLGIKDVFLLIVAILKVVIKYFKCIVSFTFTTIFGGCFIPHVITFIFYILYLIFPITSFLIYSATRFDLDPYIDSFFEMLHRQDNEFSKHTGFHVMQWPQWINMWCYMCFFQEVKLKDVLDDVMVVKQVGDLITHDFNVTMPRYLRPAKNPAISAKRHLDAAFE